MLAPHQGYGRLDWRGTFGGRKLPNDDGRQFRHHELGTVPAWQSSDPGTRL